MTEAVQKNRKQLLYGLCTVVITFVIVMSCWRLWGTDINVPLTGYRHDSVGVLLEASNYVRGGSTHVYVNQGAPYSGGYSGSFGDSSVPMPMIKLLWILTGSVEASINIHAILNILLLAVSMFAVCIKLKLSDISSMIAGIAYANLAYFLMYANTLLMIYSFCFYIPFFGYILIDLLSDSDEIGHKELSWSTVLFTAAVMFYFGLNSAYYSFMAIIILAFTGLHTLFASKCVNKVLSVIISLIAMGIGIAVYTMPTILHSLGQTEMVIDLNQNLYVILLIIAVLLLATVCFLIKKAAPHITMRLIYLMLAGMMVVAGVLFIILKRYTNYIGNYEGRSCLAVEMGALRIINMIMPAPNNAIDAVNQPLRDLVDVSQGDYTVLGILTGIGLIYSVMNVFQYQEKRDRQDHILRICGLFNCFMVVLAIKGGLASLVAMFVTTGIRNYNRIIVFAAFFSLVSLAILVDRIMQKVKNISRMAVRRVACVCVYGVLLILGVMSVPTYFIFDTQYGLVDYEQRKEEYDEWHRYIGEIESLVPEGSTILELPLSIDSTYQGILMEERGQAYELAVPVIVSKTTIWSNSGGAKSARWKQVMNEIDDVGDLLLAAGAFGFQGIYVDTLMYKDNSGDEIVKNLEKYLGDPIVCNENRRYFFSMSDYNKKLQETYTDEQMITVREKIEEQF